jgi:hypothetical protein
MAEVKKKNITTRIDCGTCMKTFMLRNGVPVKKMMTDPDHEDDKTTYKNFIMICGINDCTDAICVTCYKNFLLSSHDEPHCQECESAWSKEYLYKKEFPRGWLDKEYYGKYRKALMLEKEVARLPDTLSKIPEFDYKNIDRILDDEMNELRQLRDELTTLNRNARMKEQKIHNIRYKLKPGCMRTKDADVYSDEGVPFLCPCPYEECTGLIQSKNMKCRICNRSICRRCRAKNDPSLFEDPEHKHLCKQEDIDSINMIKKDSKKCPQCRVFVYRAEGCSQMWCANCKVFFDWVSEKIVRPKWIHNPDALKYMRDHKIEMPRVGANMPCGGFLDRHKHCILVFLATTHAGINGNVLDNIRHAVEHETGVTRLDDMESQYEVCRFMYLTGQTTKDKWREEIYKIERKHSRCNMRGNYAQMMQFVITERFRNLYETLNEKYVALHGKNLPDTRYMYHNNKTIPVNSLMQDAIKHEVGIFMKECDEIRTIVNNGLIEIHKVYGGSNMIYDEKWRLKTRTVKRAVKQAVVTPVVTADATPVVTADATPVVTADATPVVTADATPVVTPVVTADVTPAATPDVTPAP